MSWRAGASSRWTVSNNANRARYSLLTSDVSPSSLRRTSWRQPRAGYHPPPRPSPKRYG
jgi:hypothetical protein